MADDVVKIELTVRTRKIQSECRATIEIDREDWEQMDDKERNDACFEELLQADLFSWDYEVKEN